LSTLTIVLKLIRR